MSEPAGTVLPDLIIDRISAALTEQIGRHKPGHCVRADNFRHADAERLVRALRRDLADGQADVHVLADRPDKADDDLLILAERAVELRNRKQRRLVLLVPVGTGATASSLDNSFERHDAVGLLRAASDALVDELPDDDDIRIGVLRISRVLGDRRPEEAWARYVATISSAPTWQAVGSNLPMVGLIPDLGGPDLIDRLPRNRECVKEIARPARAVASVTDRLSKARLKDSPVRARLADFLSGSQRDLSNPGAWTAELTAELGLTFERWPLTEPKTVAVDQVRVDPFLSENGTVVKSSRLKQEQVGDLPYTEAGENAPGVVRVRWRTVPAKTEAIFRWLIEVLPPKDMRDGEEDTEPKAKITVAGSRRTATVAIDLEEADLEQGSLFVVRVTGLDTAGQPVLLQTADNEIASDESQQFTVRWEADLITGDTRRASAWALALGKLDAVLDGQDDLTEDAYSLDDTHSAMSLRLGGRRTVLLGLSPVLVHLQRHLFEQGNPPAAFIAAGRLGAVLDQADIQPVEHTLPPTLFKQRRETHALLSERKPRDLVESLEWDAQLREKVRTYCQTFTRALDKAVTDPTYRDALLAMDTLTLNISIAGGEPIQAVVVLPFHPLRLSWLAEYDNTVTGWATELANGGLEKAQRRMMVDAEMVRRVTPANLPFAVPGSAADGIFLHAREATIGTGIYLAPEEREPGIAVQAVFDVLGIDRRDVATDVPTAMLASRISTYRQTHSHPDAVRLLAINPGSGELLAQALRQAVLTSMDTDSDVTRLAGRAEVMAYSTRLSITDPLPALTDLQRAVGGHRVGSTRSYLKPPLGLTVRSFDRIAKDDAPVHLSVVNNLAVVEAGGGSAVPESTTSFRNLLTPTSNRPVDTVHGRHWETSPAVRLRESRDGKNKDGAADAVDAHRAHQAALAAAQGLPAEHGIALRVTLGVDETRALMVAHERSDWVLSIDRNLGLELYSSKADAEQPYILDYAPDFLEGIGPRLTVTTTHQGEIERLLSEAMRNLNFADDTQGVRSALRSIQKVSGRLALRLIGQSDLAIEAVGLAALLAWLESRGELTDTIIVPVDVHRDVFGIAAEQAQLCDLILVRATRQSIRMECVEVKPRRATTPPAQLAEDIADQLDATVSMLESAYLRTDPPRLDTDLQRARLAGILRHHARRAFAIGMLSEERLATAERHFARIEDGATPEISKQGYIINLDGERDFPSDYRGVPIEVLTAAKLRKAGVATVIPSRPSRSITNKAKVASAAATAPEPTAEPASDTSLVPGQEQEPIVDPAPTESVIVNTDAVKSVSSGAHTLPTEPEGRGLKDSGRPGKVQVMLGRDAHSVEVNWQISTSGSPHMFILGIPGQGKSVTTRRILNAFADQRLPALVVDFHGDMAAAPAAAATVVDAADGLDFSPFELRVDVDHHKYAQAAWELAEVVGYVSGLGEIQRNVVYEALRELYQRHGYGSAAGPTGLPAIAEFAKLLEQKESAGHGRNVAARTRPLSDFGLFRDNASKGRFGELLAGGVVLDVHTLMEQVQLAAAAFVLRKVYQEMFHWGKTNELRLAVVLDEAHRLAKDVTLPKIMKEGRKYGVAVVVASQGVDDFHRDVLGNAGTKVAFRCNYPQSRAVAGFLRGRAGQDMALALEKLSVGQAYVSTPDSPEARKVFMER
jgi:hypothetical protein